jgi:hypothetical protein
LPQLPDNYVFHLGFQPTLPRQLFPYPSIVSNYLPQVVSTSILVCSDICNCYM